MRRNEAKLRLRRSASIIRIARAILAGRARVADKPADLNLRLSMRLDARLR
jgi:hypothetical protein